MKKQDIIQAWQNIPPSEKVHFKRYLKGDMREVGPYGFTSTNIMVRGQRVNLWGLDDPVTIAALRKVIPLS